MSAERAGEAKSFGSAKHLCCGIRAAPRLPPGLARVRRHIGTRGLVHWLPARAGVRALDGSGGLMQCVLAPAACAECSRRGDAEGRPGQGAAL